MDAIKQLTPEQYGLVCQVDELLSVVQGELDASVNPHRVALRHLGVDAMGWIKVPYNDGAFATWSQHYTRQPDDVETIHHLAIMHHARAIDCEGSRQSKEADIDWQEALRHWHYLWQSDLFWQRIAGLACKNAKLDAVCKLRNDFPELLLQIHYDLAFSNAEQSGKRHRTNFHIDLALNSPFPLEAKFNVRRRTYEQFISDVPKNVWEMSVLDPATIKEGTDRIEAYLKVDPGCVPALVDAARLQARLLRAWYSELQAEGDPDSGKSPTIDKLKSAADYWCKYLDQLIDVTAELDDDIRQKLALWFRVMGDVHRRLDKHEEAITFYQKGIKVSSDTDDERHRCVRSRGEVQAYVAREKAYQKKPGAKAYCDRIAKEPGLSIVAHRLLANAYSILREFDNAEEICRRGISIEPDTGDFDEMQRSESERNCLTALIDSVRVQRLVAQAFEHMKSGGFSQALPLLDQSTKIDSTSSDTLFLRCRCHLALEHVSEARADLETLKSLDDSHDSEKQFKALESQVLNATAVQMLNQMNDIQKAFDPVTAEIMKQVSTEVR